MVLIQLVTYISILIAIIAMAIKALRYITASEHFRWELYPVPHEKGRADYGGSFLEELDWWNKPRHSDMLNEIKEMMKEVFLLKGVYHHNRRVWTFSLPFHFGLYLCIGWLMLLLVGSIIELSGISVSSGSGTVGVIIYYATVVFGYPGFILTGIGALGLLIWRISDKKQRGYNSPADYINLILFDILIAVILTVQLTSDPGFSMLRDYVASLVAFRPASVPDSALAVEIVLISLMIMYIPLTRMSHFVAKYFLYHSVRWNDEPNLRGSDIEKRILHSLDKKVDWSAPHIQTGKTWSDVIQDKKNEQ
jgi:nitrate reductase gamma subunit